MVRLRGPTQGSEPEAACAGFSRHRQSEMTLPLVERIGQKGRGGGGAGREGTPSGLGPRRRSTTPRSGMTRAPYRSWSAKADHPRIFGLVFENKVVDGPPSRTNPRGRARSGLRRVLPPSSVGNDPPPRREDRPEGARWGRCRRRGHAIPCWSATAGHAQRSGMTRAPYRSWSAEAEHDAAFWDDASPLPVLVREGGPSTNSRVGLRNQSRGWSAFADQPWNEW
jgi:hypothetical protein